MNVCSCGSFLFSVGIVVVNNYSFVALFSQTSFFYFIFLYISCALASLLINASKNNFLIPLLHYNVNLKLMMIDFFLFSFFFSIYFDSRIEMKLTPQKWLPYLFIRGELFPAHLFSIWLLLFFLLFQLMKVRN